ncbi:MAG: aminodeoxychorismate synthase, component I [Kordiimonas sp.]|nr:aminodeoxychorismate synthase, component I [Kordiimonas sp.]|tara:strand:+ start:2346 stop:4256 length:1911 start_codon:yes stop_codon:yes gene_type:complete
MVTSPASDIWLLFENTLPPTKAGSGKKPHAVYYQNPEKVITARTAQELTAAYAALQQSLDQGYHAAGWVAYEAGLMREARLSPLAPATLPGGYMWMGLFKEQHRLDQQTANAFWKEKKQRGSQGYVLRNNRLSQSKADYTSALRRIQDYLQAGDVYQVNYTLKRLFDLYGSAEDFYIALRQTQPVGYSAYLHLENQHVLSLSPELFIHKKAELITTRPMKGTSPRGMGWADDQQLHHALQHDEKNRAENLMIVDLLRNDLGRLAKIGSVNVPHLYDVEQYRSVLQMTSTITAELRDDLGPLDVLKSLFPCGSITGAPKIRAMEIIDELETAPRGIYTGTIGYITPEGDMQFSIPIRTITLTPTGISQAHSTSSPESHPAYHGEMGIGSGIVADSDPETEYQECLLKGQFAFNPSPRYDLIETLRWTRKEGYYLKAQHFDRLEKSAAYFGYPYDPAELTSLLDMQENSLLNNEQDIASNPWRIRVLLSPLGALSITATQMDTTPLSPPANYPHICLSATTVQRDNIFLYHKTTQRKFYDDALSRARAENGCIDVIFTNENGELTEGAISNIFVEKNGRLYTPPQHCGLLAGTLRQSLLDDPTVDLTEKVLTPDDLKTADRLFIGNALRGLIEVRLQT